ncbi:hypothetical protein BS47DRAFT_1010540 [Hydnum rufescens UP504]|uniref:MARVEL domain-containing protein n=1 Tax=Hydnum rufescens UP504 TaxID=1448309 RepID=A0A9P6AW15_9AGAM|nr:hypothetical protein BS47DRAFT_1010540 [Hydnum rufescens UP504]
MTASTDDRVRRGYPILFGLVIVLAIIEMSIAGFLTSRYNTHHNFPSTSLRDRARYLLFVSIWTIIFGAFYIVIFLTSGTGGSILASVASHGIFLFVTWVFWLAGAASVTASLDGGHNCSSLSFNLPYCNQLNALMGFAWVECIGLIILFILGVRAVRRGDGFRGQLTV